MDQHKNKINDAINALRDETTSGLVALYRRARRGMTRNTSKRSGRMLFARGVSDPATYVASHAQEPRAGSHTPGFGAIGVLIGGLVRYLLGTSTPLSFFGVVGAYFGAAEKQSRSSIVAATV